MDALQVGAQFESYCDMRSAVSAYETSTGNKLWIRSSTRLSQGDLRNQLVVSQIAFCCVHGRSERHRSKGIRNRTRYKSEVLCPMKLKIRLSKSGNTLEVVRFDSLHMYHHYSGDNYNFDLKLIEAIRNNPCLYDNTNHKSKDIRYKSQVWAELASRFQTSTKKVKQRWKLLKVMYRKRQQAKENSDPLQSSTNSNSKSVDLWPFYYDMSFIDGTLDAEFTFNCDESYSMESDAIHPAVIVERLEFTQDVEELQRIPSTPEDSALPELSLESAEGSDSSIQLESLEPLSPFSDFTSSYPSSLDASNDISFASFIASELSLVPEPDKSQLKLRIVNLLYSLPACIT